MPVEFFQNKLRNFAAGFGKIQSMKNSRKKKPVVRLKNPCTRKRGARKVAADPKTRARILAACAEILAEDRNAYFDGLLAIWE